MALTDTNVAGKKVIVTTAIALVADASLLASSPMRTWILLLRWAAALKACLCKIRTLREVYVVDL
jgi:hypothetical protein